MSINGPNIKHGGFVRLATHGKWLLVGVATLGNILGAHPDLAKEWHPTKNGNISPLEVKEHSGKRAWWICKKGHEWKTSVCTRATGSACPHCRPRVSRVQVRVYAEIKHFFQDATLCERVNGFECDIFIPSLKIAIEVDGVRFHKGRESRDRRKNKGLKAIGVRLIRLREAGLKKLGVDDLIFTANAMCPTVIADVLKLILTTDDRVSQYLNGGKFIAEVQYLHMLETFPAPPIGMSLAARAELVAKQWHPTKNGKLTPFDFTAGSSHRAWWLCECGHEWDEQIAQRAVARKYGCPFCSGRRVDKSNCLNTVNPLLASEWHPTKNGSLNPTRVAAQCNKRVWWVCKNGHEWAASICGRNNSGSKCRKCSGRLATPENCLSYKLPSLAAEWHPTRNGGLKPSEVTVSSGKRVWWIDSHGREWQSQVSNRSREAGRA